MTPLFNVAQIRQIESAHTKAHPKTSLMQRAGEAVAQLAIKLRAKSKKTILILAGPGNNGGDAWVAARALQSKKIPVIVWPIGEQKVTDPAAKKAQLAYLKAKGTIAAKAPPVGEFGLIIDGIFGIGLTKPAQNSFRDAIQFTNASRKKFGTLILSIDVPSGLNANTGVAHGDTVMADATLTFIAAKPGLYTADGSDHCGKIHVNTLSVTLPESTGHLLTEASCTALIPIRRNNSHKGTYGHVGIIGGTTGMVGAAVLAARAALHIGPGKVFMGLMLRDAMAFDAINPEIMVRAASDVAEDRSITAYAIGMGMGDSKNVKPLLATVLNSGKPTLIDADALAFVGIDGHSNDGEFDDKHPVNARQSAGSACNIVLTPHPGEAARLLKITTDAVQQDRIAAALTIAQHSGAIAVLKGAGTVIATPDGHYFINPTGNPGMASGGMGDALSGMIAAFMAQGLSALDAAQLGVYLHGAAADCAAHHGMGPLGLTASEVIFEARSLLNAGLEDHHHD